MQSSSAEFLRANGLRCDWYLEEDVNHPVHPSMPERMPVPTIPLGPLGQEHHLPASVAFLRGIGQMPMQR
ncbi:hypothetical protein J7E49_17215 [Variovorax paradoxus]|nr:hypothetical protein [Variovorax paradoxus]